VKVLGRVVVSDIRHLH